MTMSLLDQSPISMSITADTESERKHLPAANSLNNKLLLADAGYISREYFADVTKAKGSYLVRGEPKSSTQSTGSLPTGRQGKCPVTRKAQGYRSEKLQSRGSDLDVSSGKYKYRLIRRWFAEENGSGIWMTDSIFRVSDGQPRR